MVPLEEPSFLWKALWKVGTRTPREYYARSNQSLEDKLWGKKPTIKEEIFEKNAATTMVVKIPIWILRSYDFTISPTQNDLNLSRIFAVVQGR